MKIKLDGQENTHLIFQLNIYIDRKALITLYLTHVCMCVCVHLCVYASVCVCVHECMCVCVCVSACVGVYVYRCMCTCRFLRYFDNFKKLIYEKMNKNSDDICRR